MKVIILWLLILIQTKTYATSDQYTSNTPKMSILDKAYKDGVVVGLRDVADVAPRLDIDVLLLNHPDTFNLLLIALMELKGGDVPWTIDDGFKVKKDDKMSYYQLAGI